MLVRRLKAGEQAAADAAAVAEQQQERADAAAAQVSDLTHQLQMVRTERSSPLLYFAEGNCSPLGIYHHQWRFQNYTCKQSGR